MWMILKPESLGKIIPISVAQRKKPLHEEDKGGAQTIPLLHSQVFPAPQRNGTGCQRAFLGGTGAASSQPGLLLRGAALQEPVAPVPVTPMYNRVSATATKGPPAGTALLGLHLQHMELYSTEYIPGKTDLKLLEGIGGRFPKRQSKGHQSTLADHAASQSCAVTRGDCVAPEVSPASWCTGER